jgi:hypothetical protein
VGDRSRGRFATPADLPLQDCSPYRGLHVRRERLGGVHRSRAVFCRPVPNLSAMIRNCFIAVSWWHPRARPCQASAHPLTRASLGGEVESFFLSTCIPSPSAVPYSPVVPQALSCPLRCQQHAPCSTALCPIDPLSNPRPHYIPLLIHTIRGAGGDSRGAAGAPPPRRPVGRSAGRRASRRRVAAGTGGASMRNALLGAVTRIG